MNTPTDYQIQLIEDMRGCLRILDSNANSIRTIDSLISMLEAYEISSGVYCQAVKCSGDWLVMSQDGDRHINADSVLARSLDSLWDDERSEYYRGLFIPVHFVDGQLKIKLT